MIIPLIDVHCHLLYGVDDGPDTIEESVEMLKEAKNQGIRAIILTPHLRHGMFSHDLDRIHNHFAKVKVCGDKLGIFLALGTEYHVDSEIISSFKDGKCHTLADTKYILAEYSHRSGFNDIRRTVQDLLMAGYIPLIAHVERYASLTEDVDRIEELREMGALIQINADAVLGLEGRSSKKFCKNLLKAGLADVIASDSHGIKNRACHMAKCYEYVAKKFGRDYADSLMKTVPETIIRGR